MQAPGPGWRQAVAPGDHRAVLGTGLDADVEPLQVLEAAERQVGQPAIPGATFVLGGLRGQFAFVFDPAPEIVVAVAVRVEQLVEGKRVAVAVVVDFQVIAEAPAETGAPESQQLLGKRPGQALGEALESIAGNRRLGVVHHAAVEHGQAMGLQELAFGGGEFHSLGPVDSGRPL